MMINSKRLYFKVYSVVLITLGLAYSLTYAFIMLLGLHYYEVWVEGLLISVAISILFGTQ